MKEMRTTRITVNTKKDTKQDTTWAVTQDRPYPSIKGGFSMRWGNAGGLLPQYGHPAEGLGTSYTATLLRADFTPETAQNNRNDSAGYDGNPGLVYRGRDMGEVTAEIKPSGHSETGWWVSFRTGWGSSLTATESALMNDQVAPRLVEYVLNHADELKADAIADIEARVAEQIVDARTDIGRLEREMEQAINAIKKG